MLRKAHTLEMCGSLVFISIPFAGHVVAACNQRGRTTFHALWGQTMLAACGVCRQLTEHIISRIAFGPKREVLPETILQRAIAQHGEIIGVIVAHKVAKQYEWSPTDPLDGIKKRPGGQPGRVWKTPQLHLRGSAMQLPRALTVAV